MNILINKDVIEPKDRRLFNKINQSTKFKKKNLVFRINYIL